MFLLAMVPAALAQGVTIKPSSPRYGVTNTVPPSETIYFTVTIADDMGYVLKSSGFSTSSSSDAFLWKPNGACGGRQFSFSIVNTEWTEETAVASVNCVWTKATGGSGSGDGTTWPDIDGSALDMAVAGKGAYNVAANTNRAPAGASVGVKAALEDGKGGTKAADSDWAVSGAGEADGQDHGVSEIQVAGTSTGIAVATGTCCKDSAMTDSDTITFVGVTSIESDPEVVCIGDDVSYTVTTQPAGHEDMVSYTPADTGTPGIKEVVAVCGSSSATCTVTVVKVASLSASPEVTPIGNSNITYTITTDPANHTNMVTLTPADCGTAGSNIATAVCGASTATCYVTVFKVELDDTTAESLRGDTISTQVQFEPEGIAETIDIMPSGFDGIHLHASYNKTGRRLDIANLIDESALECWLDTAAIHVDAWANGVNWIDWTKNLLMKKELVEIWEDVKEKGADKLNDFASPGDWAGEEVHDWLSDIFAVDSQGMVHWINPAAIDSAQLYARNTVNGLWTAFIREFIWSGIPTEDIEAAVVKETWEPEFDYDVELECAGGTISLDPHIEDLFTWIDSIGETGFSSETFSFQSIMLEASLSCDRETAEAIVAAQMNIFLKYGNNVIDGETGQSYEGSVSFGVSVQIVFSFY